jgi:hypothetical protein
LQKKFIEDFTIEVLRTNKNSIEIVAFYSPSQKVVYESMKIVVEKVTHLEFENIRGYLGYGIDEMLYFPNLIKLRTDCFLSIIDAPILQALQSGERAALLIKNFLRRCPNLKSLAYEGKFPNFTGSMPFKLKKLMLVESFQESDNNNNHSSIEYGSGFSSPKSIINLLRSQQKSLQELFISSGSSQNLDNVFDFIFTNLPQLHTLALRNVELKDRQVLKTNRTINKLIIKKFDEYKILSDIMSALPNVEYLKINKFDFYKKTNIGKHLRNLKHIRLNRCPEEPLGKFPNLESLIIQDLFIGKESEDFFALGSLPIKQLKVMNAHCDYHLTFPKADLEHFLNNLPNLEVFYFGGCFFLDEETANIFVNKLKKLKKIVLVRAWFETEDECFKIAKQRFKEANVQLIILERP